MKFSIDADDFRSIVKRVIKVVPTKSTLPALEHIHVSVTEEGKLTAIATDMDATIRTVIEINALNVIEPGEVLLPAKRLKDGLEFAIGMLDVTIEDEKKAIIKGKGRKLEMKVLPTGEYFELPQLDVDDDDHIGTFVDGELARSLAFVKDAISSDQYRAAMTGVYFDLKYRSQPVIVSTNSFILAKYALNEDYYNSGDKVRPFILPKSTVDYLTLLRGDIRVDGVYAISSITGKTDHLTHVQFSDGFTDVTTRIIDEKYPPYNSVIPKEFKYTAAFKPKELLNAIQSVSGFANQTQKSITFSFEPERCVIKALDDESGTYSDVEIECAFSGEAGEEPYGFNYSFLIDAVNSLKSCEEVIMGLNGPGKAVILQEIGKPLTESLRLNMPIRLKEN